MEATLHRRHSPLVPGEYDTTIVCYSQKQEPHGDICPRIDTYPLSVILL